MNKHESIIIEIIHGSQKLLTKIIISFNEIKMTITSLNCASDISVQLVYCCNYE